MGKLECSFHFFLSPSHFPIIARQRSSEKVMFLQMFVWALEYDATSCLALWSHVISGGMMSLSVWLSVPMFFFQEVGLQSWDCPQGGVPYPLLGTDI